MARGLEACGVTVEEDVRDTLIVHGLAPVSVRAAPAPTHLGTTARYALVPAGDTKKPASIIDGGRLPRPFPTFLRI
jgi:hypothetical protein